MTPFQMHLGRKPRTALTNIISKSECLLFNWKRTLSNYISAQPTELQVVTINDAEGEMTDYLVFNDARKRNRLVSREFKKYQILEKENKPNSMKCGFKTNKTLTAIKKTDHTVTTSDGRTIYKKLASKTFKISDLKENRRTEEGHHQVQKVRKIQQRQILRSTPTLRQQQQRRRGRTQHQSRSPDDAHKEEIQADNRIRLIQRRI